MTFQVFVELEQQEKFSSSVGVFCMHLREAIITYSCEYRDDVAGSKQVDGVDCFPP